MNLSNLDPNVAFAILGAVGSIAVWIKHKITGERTESFGEVIQGVVDNAIHDAMVTASSDSYAVVSRVDAGLWMGLVAMGVPRNATTSLLAHAAVQRSVAAAIQEAKDHDKLVAVEMAKAMAALKAASTTPVVVPGPAVPALDIAIETMPRSGNEVFLPGFPIK